MINIKVTDQVAKLLATENVIIEHQSGAGTASFNVDTRVLTLPIWENSTKEIYDLLICHEVGHALFTPNDILPKDVCHSCLNVVEDVRIEKLMRQKYGGVAKVFFKGYQEFVKNDFFKIKNKKIKTYNLADRINLYFKIGRFVDIPFHNQNEKEILKLTNEIKTFQDAIKVAKLLYKYCKQESTFENDLQFGKEIIIKIGETSSSSSSLDSIEISLDSLKNQQNENEEDSEVSENLDSSGEEDSEVSENLDSSGEEDSEGGESGSDLLGSEQGEVSVCTMESALKELEKLVKRQTAMNLYIPNDINSDEFIIKNNIVHEQINEAINSQILYKQLTKDYQEFRHNAKSEVNHLVKEFETRKSADQYRRALVAKTGTLDCSNLHKYKYEEDIFNRTISYPDGKNHGLIFLLDWSGSMGGCIKNTLNQLYYLVWFCKKVGIAFDVYAFSSYSVYEYTKNIPRKYHNIEAKNLTINNNAFSLLHFLTSQSSASVLYKQMETLYVLASNFNTATLFKSSITKYTLGGTPLNDALLTLPDIISKFIKKYRTQKTHCIVLTDGESNSAMYYDYSSGNTGTIRPKGLCYCSTSSFYCSNKKTGKIYTCDNDRDLTEILVQNVRDIFPELSIIGFRLAENLLRVRQYKDLPKDYKQKIKDQWDKDGCAYIKSLGYSTMFLIHTNILNTSHFPKEKLTTKNDVQKFITDKNLIKKKNKKILTEFSKNIS